MGEEENAAQIIQVRSIGKIGSFDESLETWDVYTERVDLYFKANGVSEDLLVPSFLAVIGPKTYGLLKNIVAPTKPANLTYQQILEHLNRHLCPKPSVIAERFRFHKREQRSSEGVLSYVAELRKLSIHCNFGETLNDTIRDRFVCGINSESVQKKLLAEPALTLDTAVKIAHAMETAGRDATELREQRNTGTVHKVNLNGRPSQKSKSRFSAKPQSQKMPAPAQRTHKDCWRCGGEHSVMNCKHINSICRYCSKKVHIERACLKKKKDAERRTGKKVNFLNDNDEHDEHQFEPMLHVHTVNNMNKVDPIILKLRIKGQPINMELDTGSSVSIIPESFYKQNLSDVPLQGTKIKLKTFTGENISPLGTVHVPVTLNQQQGNMDLVVVRQNGPALFGRDGLSQFKVNWHEVKVFKLQQTTQKTDTMLKEILDKHQAVFRSEIGKLEGITASLYLEDSAQPKFCKARPVPYSLKPKVEEELKRLEKEGIIKSVTHSKWASPVVPVVKKNGQVCVETTR
ncbi:uncharacterized protein LOC134277149 [Saccostrea cucullata]|uniref:uncharacterized protein LOC134277149 n=1 Tax=Saccostrea cuccullata TaxID=36930 RepID=UPI002ED5C200